jgi:hypothetical protein
MNRVKELIYWFSVIVPICSFIWLLGFKSSQIDTVIKQSVKLDSACMDIYNIKLKNAAHDKNIKYLSEKTIDHDMKLDMLSKGNEKTEKMYGKIETLLVNSSVMKNDIDWIKQNLKKDK